MRKKGFTLVELLVVIAIIALLVSILLPALSKAREQAKMAVCMTRVKGILTALNTYSGSNDNKLPPTTQGLKAGIVGNPLGNQNFYTLPITFKYHYGGRALGGGGLFVHLQPYLPDARYLFCPVMPEDPRRIQEKINNLDDPETGTIYGGYYYLWNWLKYKDHPIRPFRPTGKYNEHNLMVADIFMGSNGWFGQYWVSAHSFQGCEASPLHKDRGGTSMDPGADDTVMWRRPYSQDDRPEIQLHAGYLDGSVRQINSMEYYQYESTILLPKIRK